MKLSASLFLILVIVVFGHARDTRHIHPRHIARNFEDPDFENVPAEDKSNVLRLANIKHNNLVPVNNILFFKTYNPCSEGMKRDILGICREVWDD